MSIRRSNCYLHSSMDRFEDLHQRYHQQQLMYLHSSMDRFEDIIVVSQTNQFMNLHSSMDRFEVYLYQAI